MLCDQSSGRFSTIEVKEVKLLTCSAAHQFRVLSREIIEYIDCQSSRGCDLCFFLETPARCQSVDAQRKCLEEPRDQNISQWIRDNFCAILVSDGIESLPHRYV